MISLLLSIMLLAGCSQPVTGERSDQTNQYMETMSTEGLQHATFGSGCFWCSETIFARMNGVKKVLPGYSGGTTKNPSYEEVCTGTTGHAEVVKVWFDPAQVSYLQLLEVFFKTHDPTTLNRQGEDVGTQYRSVVFYHDDIQKEQAMLVKSKLTEAGIWDDPIVTEVSPAPHFYEAEAYHHNYFERNPNQGYCQFVILPKVEKFEKLFGDIIRK